MKSNYSLFLIQFLVILIAWGCGDKAGKTAEFKERQFIIGSKQTITIHELDMEITNNGCGRKWVMEENQPAFERPICELVIRKNDSTFSAGRDFEPLRIGNIEIEVDAMNPWGRVEDSVPPGGCRLWVRMADKVKKSE